MAGAPIPGERRAVVAGGGIVGLAAAAALARKGWRVALFEARPGRLARADLDPEDPAALGAGIQASPNATRCLSALGALDAVAEAGFAPRAACLRDGRSGRVVYRAELGRAARARWGAPYLHVHRHDLARALAGAARDHGAALADGMDVTGWHEGADGVVVETGDGGRASADLLVLADGIGSRLAARALGTAEPRFTGQTAWRALVAAGALAPGTIPPEATVWAAPGRHAVSYYVAGGQLVNLVAVEERSAWEREGWSEPGDAGALRAAFADFAPPLRALVAAVGRPKLWGLFERETVSRWSAGRVVALGDAAHAMLPFMAQGAAMAIEDAVVLARHLDAAAPEAALAAWEVERRPRVARVAATSRANGAMFHRADGPRRALSHAAIGAVSRLAPSIAAGRLDWLYGHDAVREG
ncbi:MAG: FAD-dependent oxidoreductase [Paracoccaceae bacterium]